MRIYDVKITGTQPLIMHRDDIEWADKMEEWRMDPANKKKSKAGEDRTPPFRWIGFLYTDETGQVVMPTENIMRCLMEGGAQVLVPGGRSGKTFKAQTQSGIIPRNVGWPLEIKGQIVKTDWIHALMDEPSFAAHAEEVKKHGFRLSLKRARIGQSKHVRVRPMFMPWAARGELVVSDEAITTNVLTDILDAAGRYKGLGDWRPGSKTPGPYGTFQSEVRLLK